MLDPRDLVERTASGQQTPSDAIPAATVVLLRDSESGPEVLMLRRNSKLEFVGGAWVFPGGRIDPGDTDRANPEDPLAAARHAAVRETLEESGLTIDAAELVWFSHWTPPPEAPKRFATWFFAARAPQGGVTIDDGEIKAHNWFLPARALEQRNALEIELAPPTWITLELMAGFSDVDTALSTLAAGEPEYFTTRIALVEGGAVVMYHGDAGYEDSDPEREGARHRLWMVESGWRYERTS